MKTEFFDLVDSQGNIIKYSVSKEEAKQLPNFYMQIAVGCIFNNKGELLVQQRSLQKSVEPGKIDKICGYVDAGETAEQAIVRESQEEAGVALSNIKCIHADINKYGKYRYLFVANSNDEPRLLDPEEVEWVKFISIDELKEKETAHEWQFVADFFENTQLAIDWLAENTAQAL